MNIKFKISDLAFKHSIHMSTVDLNIYKCITLFPSFIDETLCPLKKKKRLVGISSSISTSDPQKHIPKSDG